jgi:glycosyl transferase family 25
MSCGSIKVFTDIKNAFYINLDHRLDRKAHVEAELDKIGLGLTAQRFNAIKMENGAVGCSMSHLKILQNAVAQNMDHVLILEDDITFLDPKLFITQFDTFLSRFGDWDVILLAGNNMPPHLQIDDTCIKVTSCQTTTGYLVNGHYISKLMNNVKMGLHHLLREPERHLEYAIDMFWKRLQSTDRWFLITPPTVIQCDGYSDIEKKMTNYSKPMLDLEKKMFLQKMKEREDYINMMQTFKNKYTNAK